MFCAQFELGERDRQRTQSVSYLGTFSPLYTTPSNFTIVIQPSFLPLRHCSARRGTIFMDGWVSSRAPEYSFVPLTTQVVDSCSNDEVRHGFTVFRTPRLNRKWLLAAVYVSHRALPSAISWSLYAGSRDIFGVSHPSMSPCSSFAVVFMLISYIPEYRKLNKAELIFGCRDHVRAQGLRSRVS